MSDLTINQQAESRSAAINTTNVWGMILAFVAYDVIRVTADAIMFTIALNAVFLAATLFFVIQDRKLMLAQYNRAPSAWWSLISIVYIWKRTTIVNQGRKLFWQAIGIGAASVVVALLVMLTIGQWSNALPTHAANVAPACSSSIALAKAEALANQTPVMRQFHAVVTQISNPVDRGYRDGVKLCQASIRISTGELLLVVLAITPHGDGFDYVASLAHQ